MEENIDILNACSAVIFPEVSSSNIIEEGPRICPLCSSEIKFFFINLNDKVLLCENIHCEFPFGYEELQFTRIDDTSDIMTIGSKNSQSSMMQTGSVISTTSWSEIERTNKIYESEDSQIECKQPYEIPSNNYTNKTKKCKSELLIQKNVEDIKGLNMELQEFSEPRKILKNEKWIKNLMSLQSRSGLRLLKPEELKQVKKENKELKIDIDKGTSSSISSIKIQIGEQSS